MTKHEVWPIFLLLLVLAVCAAAADKKKTEYTCTTVPYTAARTIFVPSTGPLQVEAHPETQLPAFHFGIFEKGKNGVILGEVWADRMTDFNGAVDFYWRGSRVMRILPQSGLTWKALPTNEQIRLKGEANPDRVVE